MFDGSLSVGGSTPLTHHMLFHHSQEEALSTGPGGARETAGFARRGQDAVALESSQEPLNLEQKVTVYFEQWRDPVLRYLIAVFGSPEEAEEITQDAFLQLYRYLSEGKQIDQTRSWIFRTAHNMALNRIKGRQFVDLLDEENWEGLQQSLSDSGPNPEQSFLHREKYERLRASIRRLTLQERQCLHLRTKGLRYREIAEVLELSVTSVAETLYRTINKLTKDTNG
jgi:RNA polymerase sigma-70 factor (ECF subfamily)